MKRRKGESFEDYKVRRAEAQRETKRKLKGRWFKRNSEESGFEQTLKPLDKRKSHDNSIR